jgi:hypothetical protein
MVIGVGREAVFWAALLMVIGVEREAVSWAALLAIGVPKDSFVQE